MKRYTALIITIVLCLSVLTGAFACDKPDAEPVFTPATFVKAADSADGYAYVTLPEGRDIRILVLSDIQIEPFNRYGYVGASDEKSYLFLEKLLTAAQPDLIILNGDMVMGLGMNNWPYMKRLADIINAFDTAWMPLYGNHDSEAGYAQHDLLDSELLQITRTKLTEELMKYSNCLISFSDTLEDGGVANYFVNVKDATGQIVYTMCGLETVPDEDDPDHYHREITAEQLDWYERHLREISALRYTDDTLVPSMLFTHVGVSEFYTAFHEAYNDGQPNEKYHYGMLLDGNYTDVENEIFTLAKELGSTKAMFFAHHHSNDMSVDYQGIRLTFGQHSGFSHNYRTDGNKDTKTVNMSDIYTYGDKRGGTEITLNKQADGSYGFTITPRYGSEIIPDYADFCIDYKQVCADLLADGWTVNGAPDWTNG